MLKKHWKLKTNNTLKKVLTLLCFFVTCTFASAVAGNPVDSIITVIDTVKKKPMVFPVPPPGVNRLFYLQRTSNTNAIIYDLNIDKQTGILDKEQPVHVYWMLFAEGGKTPELTFIQRKFAYGVHVKPLGGDKYDIRIVSYKKFPLTLMKGADGKYHIFAKVLGKQIVLHRIFINIEGGSLWSPNVVYVEMKGIDPVTGKEITERFKP
jgi:hypothetical protein